MDISTIVSQLTTLLIILAAGYICYKLKLFNEESNKFISKLVLNLTMPCTILGSVIGDVEATGGDTAYFMLMTILAFAFLFAVAIPLTRALRISKSDRGLYTYMLIFGNAAFMGFPVAQSVFGDASAFFVALFNIPFTLLTFSVGIIMISGERGKINPRILINPSLIAGLLTLTVFLTGLKIPDIIGGAIKLVGGVTTPCAMLVIGSTLAAMPFRDVFSEWRLYPLVLVRLAAMPLITWLLFRNFISNELMLGVITLLCGMPVASAATMLATKYGGNEHLASKSIFLTTLLSAFSIPLLMLLLFT